METTPMAQIMIHYFKTDMPTVKEPVRKNKPPVNKEASSVKKTLKAEL